MKANDRLRFRTPIYGADGKFKKFVFFNAIDGSPAITCSDGDVFKETEQCTGLKDRNGKLIYEGDICTYWIEGDWTREVLVKIGFDKKSCYWYINYEGRDYKSSFYCSNIATLKIIGNIHHNPELLGEVMWNPKHDEEFKKEVERWLNGK